MPSARARRSVIAVAGAVVSKPIAKKTTSRSGLRARELERVERRVDHPHVGAARLRLEQRAAAAGDAHHVAEGREDHLRAARRARSRRRRGPSGSRRPGSPGPCRKSTSRRHEVLEPVLVDRVRVPAADLHELHVAAGLDERLDLVRELLRQLAGAELVDVLHAPPALRARSRRGRAARRRRATGATSSIATCSRAPSARRSPCRRRRRRRVASTATSPQVMQRSGVDAHASALARISASSCS